MNARLNWILFAFVIFLIGVNIALFLPLPRWWTEKQNKNEPSCLKVSDFYSVHLTTYFLPDSGKESANANGKKLYMPYCDQVPGTGQAVFTIDLMEQDARDQLVALSLSHYDASGHLALVTELPRAVHPGGVLTLGAAIEKPGKYLLRLTFGEGKSKDEIIEMPILAGR